MPRTRRHPRRTTATLLLAAALTLATTASACSDDPDLDPGPPAPAQITSNTPAATPDAGDPVISIAPTAEQFADDPAVVAFRDYVSTVTHLLRAGGDDRSGAFDVMTGTRLERFITELDQYQNDGFLLYGTPEFRIVDISVADNQHTHLAICELDSAAYPVRQDGSPVRPLKEGWIAYEYWMTMIDEKWKLEFLYTADHLCENI